MFARIMTQPPAADSPRLEPDSGESLARVVGFARTLAGTLRPPSVLDRLEQEVKATFTPTAFGAVLSDEQGHEESARGDTGHSLLGGLLREVLRTGRAASRRGTGIAALAVPLAGRRRLLGAMGFSAERAPALPDLHLLESFGAVAAVALEATTTITLLEETLRRSEATLDAVSFGFCLLDPMGRVERVNRAFTDLLGRPAGGIQGQPWQALVPPAWHPGIAARLETATPEAAEFPLGDRVIGVTAVPASQDPGRQVLILEDQTDRHRLQDRLVQSEKLSAIGQLIAGVAHDLNNPLTSVVGFADFLAETTEVPARLHEPLRVIQQEAERASRIVKNLLSFARRQESRRPASLVPILEGTVALFRNQLSGDRVALEAAWSPDLPELDLNPTQIQQVFVNLLQNATQAITGLGRPGTIRITARRWMDGVAVDVQDDGPGMPGEIADRVFEPFFTTKPEGQGTGLGLSISQGIAKEHGGRITLATAPGAGSTFTVELPGRVGSLAAPAPLPRPEPARPLRVLVVDDEPHILHYIRATLEAWGHAVATAADGQVGLERATQDDYDLIITDLRMPRLGGREFYEALLAHNPRAARRVAFSTGDTVRGDTLAFLAAQGRPCLHKPFSLSELRGLLHEAARR
jgi:signal transduction histidine kinase